jgi:hypothetical protein
LAYLILDRAEGADFAFPYWRMTAFGPRDPRRHRRTRRR